MYFDGLIELFRRILDLDVGWVRDFTDQGRNDEREAYYRYTVSPPNSR